MAGTFVKLRRRGKGAKLAAEGGRPLPAGCRGEPKRSMRQSFMLDAGLDRRLETGLGPLRSAGRLVAMKGLASPKRRAGRPSLGACTHAPAGRRRRSQIPEPEPRHLVRKLAGLFFIAENIGTMQDRGVRQRLHRGYEDKSR